jgi:hypothetical protein
MEGLLFAEIVLWDTAALMDQMHQLPVLVEATRMEAQ